MELWIRSQDKMNLVKIRQISLNYSNKKQIIANYTPESYENSGGYYELLGTYETKGRTIEVLDEIQNILKPKYILDTSSIKPDVKFYIDNGNLCQNYSGNTKIEELSTFVYQMPEK